MFTWLADAWRRRRRRKTRNVFRFFDGRRTRAVDPWQICVALETHPKFRYDMADAIKDGEIEETEIAVAATSEVFGIPRFKDDENGLTDGELVEILAAFVLFTHESKKKYERLSTSLPVTAGESSNAATSSETGSSPMDSGSTCSTPKHATPSVSSAV